MAEVEVVAALRRTERTNGEQSAYIDALVALFNRNIAHYENHFIPVDPIVPFAASLCSRYAQINPGPLRSLDAIQLACAVAAGAASAHEMIFVTSDMRLAAAAAVEGLRVINPTYPPVSPLTDPTQSS